jgi:UDP-N-acetylmuramate dehydrogenase
MKILEQFDLKEFSSMKIGGVGAYLAQVNDEKDLLEAVKFAKKKKLPIHVLGSGTNSVFEDGTHQKLFIQFKNSDIIKTYEDEQGANILVSAGTIWDDFVLWSVEHNLSGAEAMTWIPGTVGASPIQNIGAYGQEASNLITFVRTFDIGTEHFFDIPNSECQFSYRNSLFKKEPNRFIVLSVSFRLKKEVPKIPQYKDVQMYFIGKQKTKPTLKIIRQAIIEIRKEKIPDPKTSPNCGSFFKNPILPEKKAQELIRVFPEIKYNIDEKGFYKFYAGWMIERAELKGHNFGQIKIDENNALVLINQGNANFQDLMEAINTIQKSIRQTFEIVLEEEVNIIKKE